MAYLGLAFLLIALSANADDIVSSPSKGLPTLPPFYFTTTTPFLPWLTKSTTKAKLPAKTTTNSKTSSASTSTTSSTSKSTTDANTAATTSAQTTHSKTQSTMKARTTMLTTIFPRPSSTTRLSSKTMDITTKAVSSATNLPTLLPESKTTTPIGTERTTHLRKTTNPYTRQTSAPTASTSETIAPIGTEQTAHPQKTTRPYTRQTSAPTTFQSTSTPDGGYEDSTTHLSTRFTSATTANASSSTYTPPILQAGNSIALVIGIISIATAVLLIGAGIYIWKAKNSSSPPPASPYYQVTNLTATSPIVNPADPDSFSPADPFTPPAARNADWRNQIAEGSRLTAPDDQEEMELTALNNQEGMETSL